MINNITSSESSLQNRKIFAKRHSKVSDEEIKDAFIDITRRIDKNSLEAIKKFIPVDEINEEDDPIIILQYIRQISFYLSKVKMDLEDKIQKNSSSDDDEQSNYEGIIQKLESDIRQHIRIEQQQRLHIENLQSKLEELIKENEMLDEKFIEMNEQFQELQNELIDKTNQVSKLENALQDSVKTQRFGREDQKQIHHLNQTNYIQQLNVGPVQSVQSSLIKKNISESKCGEPDENYQTDRINSKNNSATKYIKKKNNSNIKCTQNQLPMQIQALFKKVYTDGATNNLSNSMQKYQSRKSNPRNRSNNNDNSKSTLLQMNLQNGQNDNIAIARNLEDQFVESERLKDEILKQLGHSYQSQRENQENEHKKMGEKVKNNLSYQKLLNQNSLLIKKVSLFDINISKKEKTELNKSTSFDAASRRLKEKNIKPIVAQNIKRKINIS